jgi:hypothetical protein
MQKSILAVMLVLGPTISGWSQACPSPFSLRAEPPMLCGQNDKNPLGWQPGVPVTVYITNAFSNAQKDAIQRAFDNWNTRLKAGVPFNFQFVNTLPTNPPTPYSEWTFVQTPDPACPPEDLACTHTGWCPNGWTTAAQTNVYYLFSDPGYQLFAHEVGHTFAMDDCTTDDCLFSVTIMDPATNPQSAMSPRCCDDKLMWQMNRTYGLTGGFNAKCTANFVQGTAYLSAYPDWSNTFVTATFPQTPQSGDAIIVGCMTMSSGPLTVTDNQRVSDPLGGEHQNTYDAEVSAANGLPPPPGDTPVTLFAAADVVAQQYPTNSQFTVKCTTNPSLPDAIDLFAVEYSDVAGWPDILDNTTSNVSELNGTSPFPCGTVVASQVNDLIVSIYNNWSIYDFDVNGVVASLVGRVPACIGGQDDVCSAQDYSLYEIGGISTYTATNAGGHTESWTGPVSLTLPIMDCALMAVRAVGP